MRLLLDENLSHKLIAPISEAFPGSVHVRNIGLKSSDDGLVWKYALENDFAIVSKDADFHQRSLIQGHPPKIVGIFAGNCPTTVIRDLLLIQRDRILQFNADTESSFLPLIAA